MYKYGDISEGTLLWQQGQLNDIGHEIWLPLGEIITLKYKVVNVPELPGKIEESSTSKKKNPIPTPVGDAARASIRPLDDFSINRSCARCGGVADPFIPLRLDKENREIIPEMSQLRSAAGSTKAASETIPGYLWIGDSQANKASVFYQMQFSLILCCCDELRNPAPKVCVEELVGISSEE